MSANMKRTSVAILGALALGVLAVSGANAQTAKELEVPTGAAAIEGPACVGPLSLPTPTVKLDRSFVGNLLISVPLSTPLNPGTYVTSAGSSDPTHPAAQDQPGETWLAIFFDGAGTEVGRTETTPDLPSAAGSQSWSLANTVISGIATRVDYVHGLPFDPNKFDSVKPDCLNLTLIPLTDAKCTGVALPTPGFKIVRPGTGTPNDAGPFTIAPLIAGTYGVSAGSRDVTHPGAPTQPGEKWQAVFLDSSGGAVGSTAFTPDLNDSDVTKAWSLGSVTLTGSAVAVRYVHEGGAGGIDSIEPFCLGITAADYPPTKTGDPEPKPPVVDPPKPLDPPAIVGPPLVPDAVVVASATVPPTAAPTTAPPTSAPRATTPTTVAPPEVFLPAEVLGSSLTAAPAIQSNVLGDVLVGAVAFTGSDSVTMALLGGAFFLFGSVLVIGARRRSSRRTA